jgi:tRNA A-37 threonylcarbamoyl transferase component Bud32
MARQRSPIWLVLAAAAWFGYFALLVYCNLARPVAAAIPAALADPSGGMPRALREAINLTLPLGPLHLNLARDGVLFSLRLVQLVTLVLAAIVVRRRPRDPVALAGGWLLATTGVFSVALPAGWAGALQSLPLLATALIMVPYLSTVAGGAVFFIFALVFTRQVRSMPRSIAAGIPLLVLAGIAPLVWHRLSVVFTVRAFPLWLPGGDVPVIAVNALAEVAGLIVLGLHYGRSQNVVEKRRARVVLAGGAIGIVAGTSVMIAATLAGPRPAIPFFASSAFTAGTALFLLFPLSLSYAILRYRLFDVGDIIRLSVRYAVARRALLSIVPLVTIAMLIDAWSQGHRTLRELLSARAGLYVMLAAGGIAAHLTRHRWLDKLDQRFFRERYDARRILIDLVGELRGARAFDHVAALATRKIVQALHPKFLVVGVRSGQGAYETSAAFRPEKAPRLPDPASTLMELARVLKQPLDMAHGSAAWLAERLPVEEVRYVREGRVELLVPIPAPAQAGDAVLLLGPRRSEEPYSREDRELLQAIADALAVTLHDRVAPSPPLMIQDVDLPRLMAGRYKLLRVIGRGGMGVVYEAEDLTLNRRVAVKLVRDELLGSEDAMRRFGAEARAAAGFAHPNVVTVHDYDAGDGQGAMLVMELLEGHTLRAELGTPLRLRRALVITGAVADAIEAAHARRLLHGDLKPENVFLAGVPPGEQVKLLDFGIARALEGMHAAHGSTLAGVLIGTPRYMAPEQLRGDAPSASWDVWALGVIAHEMLTARHPFADAGPPPTAPLTPPLERFFRDALSPDPAHRPSTARELRARLEEAAHGASV